MSDALRLEGVARSFREGPAKVEVLRGVSCAVAAGEIVALLGPSGSGKTTLLQIAGLLDRPTDGEVWIEGAACGRLSDSERTATRRHRLGFVYQFHHRLPEFSALENVAMPRRIAGANKRDAADHARALLHRLGLGERLDHRTAEDVFHALLNLVREARVGALIATHNTELARHMDRRLHLQDGALTEE